MATWFTADLHLGHANIIKYCQRPFETVEEMDCVLIDRWNARVKPGDLIYVVGDFSLRSHTIYLPSLNGDKILIPGNHDPKRLHRPDVDPLAWGWRSVSPLKQVKVQDGSVTDDVVLCHYAMRVWNKHHYGALHFYGHSHGGLPGDSQSCDVGVDCWGYQPVSISEIKLRLATLPAHAFLDHHTPDADAAL